MYPSEVDDKGIDDLVVRLSVGRYAEVQVKSIRAATVTVFARKSVFPLDDCRYLALVRFSEDVLPEFYLMPARAWNTPNELFRSRDYEGKKSPPEWGLNISNSTLPLLQSYRFEDQVQKLLQ